MALSDHRKGITKHKVEHTLLLNLENNTGEKCPSILTVAKALGYSERTLRRKLKQEGTSFRQLRDNVLRKNALDFLQKSDMPIIDISYLLGYKDQSTFNHAFRNWYNESPGQFRKRVTKKAD